MEDLPYYRSSNSSSQEENDISSSSQSREENDDFLVYSKPQQELEPPNTAEIRPTFDPNLDLPIAHRKGRRQCTYPIAKFISYKHIPNHSYSFITSLDSISIPKNIIEALSKPEWKKAMIKEMNALELNNTWDLVTLPNSKKAIGCRWIYTVKMNPNGTVA